MQAGLLSVVSGGGSQRLQLDGVDLVGPSGAAIRLVHRARYVDREVVTGLSGCRSTGASCAPDRPFFVLMRTGLPTRVLQAQGIAVTPGFGAVSADDAGVTVDIGIGRGTQWRATLTTRDGIHLGSEPAAIRALDDAQCAEVSLALRECSLTEASSCTVPGASASQLTAARRNALTRLYNTTTGFDQGGFLALCSAACAERTAPSPEHVLVGVCSGAEPAQWATPSLPWLPGAPPVVVPATASTGSTGAAGAAAAAETTAAATAEPGAGPVDAQARMDRSRSPPLDAFYPSAARRDGITGATVVQVCTDASGKLRGEPTIGESSGSSALDAAALRWASFASFVPATRDGSPVAACFSFRVRFDLTD